jgi:ADP-ribosylation factor-binding protein GGA
LKQSKINDAYQMVKNQGIVKDDPTYVEKVFNILYIELKFSLFFFYSFGLKFNFEITPRIKNPIFEDEEKSKQLARLLKSKNPQDLEMANRLIKNMVKQEEMKIEKTSHRINELEHINNNMKLLSEMLLNYNKSKASDSETETIKVIIFSICQILFIFKIKIMYL